MKPSDKVPDWVISGVILFLMALVPGGILAAWYFKIWWLALISVAAFLFFMGG